MAPSGKRIWAKLILMGDSGTGKSSLVKRFLEGKFLEQVEATIGCAFNTKDLTVDGRSVHLDIWDTAGQERYHSLAPVYLRGAKAVIIVYDISRKASYDRVKTWVHILRNEVQVTGNPEAVVVLAGNKADLLNERAVRLEEAEAYAGLEGFMFAETSAKTGANVDKIFMDIAQRLVEAQPPESQHEGLVNPQRPTERVVSHWSCCS